MSYDYKVVTFPNLGFIEHQFDKYQLAPILDEINEIESNNFSGIPRNSDLAGNLEKEFTLHKSKDYLSDLILPFCTEYDKHFEYLSRLNILTKNLPIILDLPWVNFQKKTEFNPSHNHSGIFSFVLWINIPFFIEDEKQNPSSKNSNANCPGHFILYYTNSLGRICMYTIPVDKNWNNKMIFFPSEFIHEVMPFYTSNDYRISVSGNFRLMV
jgi:hypothetical protein